MKQEPQGEHSVLGDDMNMNDDEIVEMFPKYLTICIIKCLST